MSDRPPPPLTLSGAMLALGPSAREVIALQRLLAQSAHETLAAFEGNGPATLAMEIAQAAHLPLANALLAVKHAGVAEGREESRAAIDLVASRLGGVLMAFAALGDRPDLAPLKAALEHAASALPARAATGILP